MPRLFYALWPAPSVRERLAQAAAALDLREGRATREENLHLTLLFVGQVDDATCRALRHDSAAESRTAFTLEIAATGWWRASRVAWLAPTECPAALVALVGSLRARARSHGCTLESREFNAHVTVAREVRRAPRATGSIAVTWPVSDYVLVSSQTAPAGSSYTVLARWPLAV